MGLVWGFGQLAGLGVLVVRPVSGVPLCFTWWALLQLVWVCPLVRLFTRVIRTATNIRGVVAAGAVLPASGERSRVGWSPAQKVFGRRRCRVVVKQAKWDVAC